MSGELYIIGTPVGNLGDIARRTVDIIGAMDILLAEDTRVTAKLLHHLQLSKPLVSCHDFNEEARLHKLETWAREGLKVGLVSDAGMPLISDPGYRIVRKAIELGMKLVPIPGPSAVLLALTASGLPCERFSFEGFLPNSRGDRVGRLRKLAADDRTLVFFVSVNDLKDQLAEMLEIFGDRSACLARELTKKFEEFIRGSLSELIEVHDTRQLRGELVLVVAGAEPGAGKLSEEALDARLEELLSSGGRLKEVASLLALESGLPKSDIYKRGLKYTRGRAE